MTDWTTNAGDSGTGMTISVPVRTGFRIAWVAFRCSVWAVIHGTVVDIVMGSLPAPSKVVTEPAPEPAMSRLTLAAILLIQFASVVSLCTFGYPVLGSLVGVAWALADAWLWWEPAS